MNQHHNMLTLNYLTHLYQFILLFWVSDSLWTYFGKPPSWKKYLWELDTNKHNNGLENEDFIIWMKTSAFPNFRKLHRIVRSQGIYTEGLKHSDY
jgi:hypothetical protein